MAHALSFNGQTWRFEEEDKSVYRLSSGQTRLEFELLPFGAAGYDAHALIVVIAPSAQGSFFSFRKFADAVSATLLSLERNHVWRVWGRALPNHYPLRHGFDWRGEQTKDGERKLVRLYQRLGLVKVPFMVGESVCLFSKFAWEYMRATDPKGAERLSDTKAALERPRRQPTATQENL